jgi:hypothetical protein
MPLLSLAGRPCIGAVTASCRQRPTGPGLLGEGGLEAAATMSQKCR